jgi:hypothetical protein
MTGLFQTRNKIVIGLRASGSWFISDRKRSHRKQVLTEEKLDKIPFRLETFPR